VQVLCLLPSSAHSTMWATNLNCRKMQAMELCICTARLAKILNLQVDSSPSWDRVAAVVSERSSESSLLSLFCSAEVLS